MSLGSKLTLAISAILAVVLSLGAWLIWRNVDRWAGGHFHDELATIASYTEEVRLRLADANGCLEQDGIDTLSIPVVVAWNTVRQYAEAQGYQFRAAAFQARNPDREPDPFETEALKAFQADPERKGYIGHEETAEEERVRYAVPVRISTDCLPCHGRPAGEPDPFGHPREGLDVGDLRGIFVVSAPLASFRETQGQIRGTFLFTGIGAILLAAFAVYLTVRKVTRPLGELTQTALRLGEGQLDERIQVGGEDEVGLLATAFNRMAESLQGYQDHLEQKVEERSRKLEDSQRQLMQAGKLASIGELASGVAHELNNPAGIILMRATRLMQEVEQKALSAEAGEDVEVIKRQVEKISRIVSGLLTFSRQSDAALRPLDMNEVVQRTVHLIEDMIRNRGVEMELELSPSLPRTEADSAQLEQVLLNLINNALDAMPEGGSITFHTDLFEDPKRGRMVSVRVQDTGIGIPEEQLSRVFDPFFTTKEVGQGTGLGLSISYGIMEKHGGGIEVESQLGEGTCITLYLPVIEEDLSRSGTDEDIADGE